MRKKKQKKQNEGFSPLEIILGFLVILWIVHFLGHIFPIRRLGLYPRQLSYLPGIITCHFIHLGFKHLLVNSMSLLTLGAILLLLESKDSIKISVYIMLMGGSLTWLLGRKAIHLGASGLIFGIFGYLLSIGIFRRKLKYILTSIVIVIFYGGMFYGIFPGEQGISWEGHLFGFISGVVFAKYGKN